MTTSPTSLPEPIVQLDALLLEHLRLEDDLEKQVARFEGRLAAATGYQYERSNIRVTGPYMNAIIESYFSRVETLAVKAFSTELAPYVPDDALRPCIPEGFYEKWQDPDNHAELVAACGPAAYWPLLAAAVNPDEQRAVAAREAAIVLGRLVGIIGGRWGEVARNPLFQPPKHVKGCVELEMPGIYVREDFRQAEVCVGDCATSAADAIQYALDAAEHDGAPVGTRLRSALLRMERSRFESRERFELGDGAHLIAFKKGYKLYLPLALAETINLFVSEHLADVLVPQQAAA